MLGAIDDKLKPIRDFLAGARYFDGVQLVNGLMEEVEERLIATCTEPLRVEKLEILRTPEAFLSKVDSCIDEEARQQLACIYAIRADLLAGLGAHKRAAADVEVALRLRPGDETILRRKLRLDAAARQADGDAQGAGGIPRTPTTIITGFLGSGKTTLLNRILEESHGKKIAVIENEFGEVGIDDALLNTKNSVMEENIIEMNNGCICCTVRGDLIAGLKKLHKQTAGKGDPLDAIIIETTGLADPAPVAQTFFADDFVQSHMCLDGILTIVDAKHVMQHLKEVKPDGIVNEAVHQVAFADRILLNKCDLVSEDYLDELTGEIRAINKTAHMRRTTNSEVDMDFVLGIRAFSLDKVLDQVNEGFLDETEHGHGDHGDHGDHGGHGGGHVSGHEQAGHDSSVADGSHGRGDVQHGRGHGHGHVAVAHDEPRKKKAAHQHDYRVSSVGIQTDRMMDKGKLDTFLSWLIKEKGQDLYRSKGVLAIKGSDRKFVFHAVHMQFSGKPQDEWKEGEKRCCKMVFIGKHLDRRELNDKFEECLV